MRIPVTYEGHKFIAIADFAGLDVECVDEPTPEIMDLGSKLWHEIFRMRTAIFGEGVEDYDTTYGELQASLKELKLL